MVNPRENAEEEEDPLLFLFLHLSISAKEEVDGQTGR